MLEDLWRAQAATDAARCLAEHTMLREHWIKYEMQLYAERMVQMAWEQESEGKQERLF